MKKVNWIFEKNIFSEYEQQLVDTIKDSDQNCYLLDDSHWNFDFDVKRMSKMFFEKFGSDEMFIRPSNGYKTFAGQLLPKENFDYEFDIFIKTQWVDIDQLVLIAPKKNVREENRFIVISEDGTNRIVDGNKYMIDGELLIERIVDGQALAYANTVVNNYTPDKAFTIDIAKMNDGTYKVLEIGSFCCASWYNMDLEKVVKEINNLAITEYKDYYNL